MMNNVSRAGAKVVVSSTTGHGVVDPIMIEDALWPWMVLSSRWVKLAYTGQSFGGVVPATGGRSLTFVGILVASKSLRSVELARAVLTWEEATWR